MATMPVRNGEYEFDVICEGPEDGTPLVLLHGFPNDSRAWAETAAQLSILGYRSYRFDQRGYSSGARPKTRFSYRLASLADDVDAVLDALDIPSACIIGHDWGGQLSWHLPQKLRHEVNAMVVISAIHPRVFLKSLVTTSQAFASLYILAIQAPVIPEILLKSRDGSLLRKALIDSGLGPADTDLVVASMIREPGKLTGALNWYRAMPLDSLSHLGLGRITTPTLFVFGDEDDFNAPGTGERTGDWLSTPGRTSKYEGASHWIPETQPVRLAQDIHGFLTSLAGD